MFRQAWTGLPPTIGVTNYVLRDKAVEEGAKVEVVYEYDRLMALGKNPKIGKSQDNNTWYVEFDFKFGRTKKWF